MLRECFKKYDRSWFKPVILLAIGMVFIFSAPCWAVDPSTGPVMCSGECYFLSVSYGNQSGTSPTNAGIDSCGFLTHNGASSGGTHDIWVTREFYRYRNGVWSSGYEDMPAGQDELLIFLSTTMFDLLKIDQYQDLDNNQVQAYYPNGCEGEVNYITDKNLGEDVLCD